MAVERFLPSAIAHFEPADLIGALTTGIVVLDSDLCVVYANVAAQDLLAVSVNQARGKPFLSLVLEADSLAILMRRALESGETLSERELAVQAGPLGRERRGDIEKLADRPPHVPHRTPQPEDLVDAGARQRHLAEIEAPDRRGLVREGAQIPRNALSDPPG